MREIRTLGSAEGAQGDPRPYSNITMTEPGVHDGAIWVFTMAGIRTPELARTLLEASTTIGVRWTHYQRRRLPREIVSLSTPHGPISFKVSRLDGRVVTVTPEFEEVRRIAREKGLPVRELLDAARRGGPTARAVRARWLSGWPSTP